MTTSKDVSLAVAMDNVNNRDRLWILSEWYWNARKKGRHSFNWHRIKKMLKFLRWKKSLLLNKTFPYFVVVLVVKTDIFQHFFSLDNLNLFCASWIKTDQLGVTCFIISLFTTQHVSNVSTSIFRSLRLIVDLFHGLYCSGSMCVGVTVWFGWGGVVSLCRLKHCFGLHKDITPSSWRWMY